MDLGVDQAASVTILTTDDEEKSWPAEIVSISGRRLTITCDLAAPFDTPVRIQSSNHLYLGEILSANTADRTMVLQIRHVFNVRDVDHMRQKWE